MGQTNWRISQNFVDWASEVEKRIMHEERRPTPTAESLLGPGIATLSARLLDWNDSVATINGFWWSSPGAMNTPDATELALSTKFWMGRSQADSNGFGLQWCTEFRPPPDGSGEVTTDDMPWPQSTYMRRWFPPMDGTARTWSSWLVAEGGGGGGGGGTDEVWIGASAPSDPAIELWYDTDATAPQAGGLAFAFAQAATSALWTIVHPLKFIPNVQTVNTTGTKIEGDVKYVNPTTITVGFSVAVAGTAYLS